MRFVEMKHLPKHLSIALGTFALFAATPVFSSTPVQASFKQAGVVIAQALSRPKVQLNLGVEKKTVAQDQSGKAIVAWKRLEGKVSVNPGDVMRYTVIGKNTGNAPAKNLVVTQPIPKQTVYVLASANNTSNAKTLYSVDNAKSFVASPTVQVKLANGKVETRPAPAETYTHVRWKFESAMNPNSDVKAEYQVKVR
jgi:uncharacterized repeat protein (TIGR01451 family)